MDEKFPAERIDPQQGLELRTFSNLGSPLPESTVLCRTFFQSTVS